MKKMLLFGLLVLGAFLLGSCGATKPAGGSDVYPSGGETVYERQLNLSLADVLRKNTSINVLGTGDNVKVVIRGISTIKLETQPLYIVDNVPLGHNYASANNAVNPNNIVSVRVLRSRSELAQYGEEGNNGVIIIKTRNSAN